MADIIPARVQENLSHKLYEKRKSAALEIEKIIRQLAEVEEDHDKIKALINLLINEFANSPKANHRKGGLIGLAAVTIGLQVKATQYVEQIVPPVLNAFQDRERRLRYYACEALYNIAKVVRGDIIVYFNGIFDALYKLSSDYDDNVQSAVRLLDNILKDVVAESDQFSIEEFVPVLRERIDVHNNYLRLFLVGWIKALDSLPHIDMLRFLPDFLDALKSLN